MHVPCAFSPRPAHARRLAAFQADKLGAVQTVLELGFGQGFFMEEARQRGIRVIGIDRDEYLVATARQAGFAAHRGDVSHVLDLISEPVDAVLASHLIEHLSTDAVRRLMVHLAKVVRPGGRCLFVTPNFRDLRVATEWFWHDPTHVRPYTPGCLSALVSPDQWSVEDEGLDPILWSKQAVGDVVRRIRYGRHYGRSGRWILLSRPTTPQ